MGYSCDLCGEQSDIQSLLEGIQNQNQRILEELCEYRKEQEQWQQKLLEKMKGCLAWFSRKKRNMNYIDWLKQNMGRLETNYNEWVNTIEAEEEDFELLFENKLEDCIFKILKRNLSQYMNALPIQCFDKKKNTFYIYNNEWRQMTDKEYTALFGKCKQLLNPFYNEWSSEINEFTEKIGDIMSKWCGSPNMPSTRKKAKKKIYNYLKSKGEISVTNYSLID